MQQNFEFDLSSWEEAEQKADADWKIARARWASDKERFEAAAQSRKQEFLAKQASANQRVDELATNVANGEPQAVIEHAGLVLEASDYGDLFESSFEIEYESGSKTLLLEYQLPSPDVIPTVKSVHFVAATGELKETHISEREQKANYDLVCYQVRLRTIHELFEADDFGNIDRTLFNGHASYVAKCRPS